MSAQEYQSRFFSIRSEASGIEFNITGLRGNGGDAIAVFSSVTGVAYLNAGDAAEFISRCESEEFDMAVKNCGSQSVYIPFDCVPDAGRAVKKIIAWRKL